MKRLSVLLTILAMLVPMLLSAQSLTPQKHPKKELYGYWGEKKNGKEGFVIKPKFEGASKFVNNHAFVRKGGLWGVIDVKGNLVVEPKYSNVELNNVIRNRYFVVEKDGRCGVIDSNSSKEVVETKYESLIFDKREEPIVKVVLGGKKGFVDYTTGQVLVGGLWFDEVVEKSKGLLVVCIEGKWGFVEFRSGRELAGGITYDRVVPYDAGTYLTCRGNLCGLASSSGEEIIPVEYDEISILGKGMYLLKFGDKYGLSNTNGEELLPVKYNEIAAAPQGGYLLKLGGKYGLATLNGEELLPVKYDALDFGDGFYYSRIGDKCGLVSADGKEILPAKYDRFAASQCGVYFLELDGKCGFADSNGKEVLELKYDNIRDWTQNRLLLKLGDTYSVVDTSGKEVYKGVCHIGDNIYALVADSWSFANESGEPVDLSDRAIFYTTNNGNALSKTMNADLHLFHDGKGVLLFYTALDKICEEAFSGCTALTSINIPNSVTEIGSSAFSGCTALTTVNIPNSVTEIDRWAFSGCTALTSVTIPDGVTKIDGFLGCTALTSITIPNSVTEIGSSAFSGCTALTSINIPNSVTKIDWCTFENCTSLTNITIPNSVTEIGREAFSGCTALTSINIPNSVTEIGREAFSGCIALTSLTIPNSITEIGEKAFQNCTKLSAFYGEFASSDNRCLIVDGVLIKFAGAGVKSYAVPSSVKRIGNGAFSGCSALASIKIPNSVVEIGSGAFDGCTSLPVVGGLRYAGNCLVGGTKEKRQIHKIRQGTRLIANDALCDVPVVNIVVPASVILIGGDTLFYENDNIVSIEFQGRLFQTYYYECRNLKRVTHKGIPVKFEIEEYGR